MIIFCLFTFAIFAWWLLYDPETREPVRGWISVNDGTARLKIIDGGVLVVMRDPRTGEVSYKNLTGETFSFGVIDTINTKAAMREIEERIKCIY